MGRRRSAVLVAAASVALLLAAAAAFWHLWQGLCPESGAEKAGLLVRLLLPGVLSWLGLLGLGLTHRLLVWGGGRRSAVERGQFYLLSHFSGTYLFEFDLRTLRLSAVGALPEELQEEGRAPSCLTARQLQALVHPEDWRLLEKLVQEPPKAEQEVRQELRLRHRGGRYVWYECKLIAVYGGRGKPLLLMGQMENIDPRKAREAMLIARSTLDDLTGLLNRRAFVLRVEEWLRSPCAEEGGALLMLDLDNFKSVNDIAGHTGGDKALTLTAQVLRQVFRSSDLLCRAGGDEFLVFVTGVRHPCMAARKAEEVCRELACRSAGEDGVPFTCSVGIAMAGEETGCFQRLFDAADSAMYRSKRAGKNSYHIHSGSDCR